MELGTHHRVVVVGGGNAGLSVAGRLRRYGIRDVAVIEPRDRHLYQPLFSHVAGGTARASQASRPQESVMPKGVTWIHDSVSAIDADLDTVTLASGAQVTYDHLVVCPGIEHDWDRIPGLAAAMRTPSVSTHYEIGPAAKASRLLRELRTGTVVFTQPPGPVSCAGASQKPMYLACDYWRATGVLDDIRVVMVVPDRTVFGIPAIDRELERKIEEYGIELHTEAALLDVDGERRTVRVGRPDAVAAADAERGTETIAYDVLHVVPPQSAPDWLAATGLTSGGRPGDFVDVDPETLQHRRHLNVWSLGDAAATRNSKSGGALRMQTKVLAKNLVAAVAGRAVAQRYTGYSVAPFTVSRGTVVFAEFDDLLRQKPSIPFWKGLARERRLTWVFDRHILPWVYWNLILKGRA